MIVRPYRAGDHQDVVTLLRGLHRQTPYAGIRMDVLSILKTCRQCADRKLATALVAADGTRIVGILLGVATPMWWNHRVMSATDLILYSTAAGAGRALCERFIAWAEALGAVKITLAQSSGMDPADGFYQALGMQRVGGVFVKVGKTAEEGAA